MMSRRRNNSGRAPHQPDKGGPREGYGDFGTLEDDWGGDDENGSRTTGSERRRLVRLEERMVVMKEASATRADIVELHGRLDLILERMSTLVTPERMRWYVMAVLAGFGVLFAALRYFPPATPAAVGSGLVVPMIQVPTMNVPTVAAPRADVPTLNVPTLHVPGLESSEDDVTFNEEPDVTAVQPQQAGTPENSKNLTEP